MPAKPERSAPREPYNITIRIQGRDPIAETAEYRALLRDLCALIENAKRAGVIRERTRKKSRKPRRAKKQRRRSGA